MVIGRFCQPLKSKTRLKTLKLKYVTLSIRILLFLLLVVEGVESHPGPSRGDRGSRGGRGGENAARGFGAPRGRGSRSNDYFANFPPLGRQERPDTDSAGLRRSQRLQGQPAFDRQPLISSWLTGSQAQGPSDSLNPASQNYAYTHSDSETEQDNVSNADENVEVNEINVTNILLEIRKDVKSMNKKFGKMEKTVKGLKRDNALLKQQNEGLSKQVSELSVSVARLEARTAETEKKNEHLEAQSRRENLKFYGLNDEQGETWEQSEVKVREYLTQELNMNVSDMGIERAHRLPSRSSPRPIIVKFSHFKDKDLVLKKYRQRRTERQEANAAENPEGNENSTPTVRVSEDFPKRVTEARAKLYPFLKQCYENESEAYLRYDKLVVDGQSYVYDYDLGRPVPSK